MNELKQQLTSIGLSQKPCYLWELSFGDCDHVIDVCHEFNIDLKCLKVIQINDLLFIANFELLSKHLSNLLSDSFIAFIDVSPDLQKPRLLSQQQIQSKKCILRDLFNELDSNSQQIKMTIKLNTETDLCLICGSLLGYPIIYCNNYHQNGNCLSHQPLCVYSVNSLPLNHCIYSFSCPQEFNQLFYSHINSWFESIRDQSIRSGNNGLSLKTGIKTMPFVLT